MISRSPLKNIGLNLSTPSVVNRLGSAAPTGAIEATHIDKAKTCSALQLSTGAEISGARLHRAEHVENVLHVRVTTVIPAPALKQPINHPAFRQHTQLGASLSINAGQFHDRRADH